MNALAFRVQSLFLQSCRVDRGAQKPVQAGLFSTVTYSVTRTEYVAGSNLVRISTQMDVGIYVSFDGTEDALEANKIGVVSSEHTATFEATRDISDDDVTDEGLRSAITEAHAALYPYHRSTIEELSGRLGVVPFRLPPLWDDVNDQLRASSDSA